MKDYRELYRSIQVNNHNGKYQGTVIFYLESKGYGFIAGASGEDLYFHIKDVVNFDDKPIRKGELIGYDRVKASQKGLQAKGIHLIREV